MGPRNVESGNEEKPTKSSNRGIIVAIIIAVGLAIGLGVGLSSRDEGGEATPAPNNGGSNNGGSGGGNGTEKSMSATGKYRYAAVASNSGICSKIGTEILARYRGHVVDGMVATILCESAMNAHDAGIGGGSFFVYYDRKKRETVVVNARETAPAAATEDMYIHNPRLSFVGGMAVGIPGEIKGLWYLHQRYGRVLWATLVQPTIDLCKNGAPLGKAVRDALIYVIKNVQSNITNDTEYSFMLDSKGEIVPEGTIVYRSKLAHTLEVIAAEGADAFYNGSLTDQIVDDIRDADGIITREDLENYQVHVTEPVIFNLTSSNLTIFSMPPPGSGVVLEFMLNILSGYNFTPDSVSSVEKTVLTYHRIVEAMKFAYAKRSSLGDAQFVDVSELVKNMTSPEYGAEIRSMIDDDKTHNTSYYGPTFFSAVKTGTSHSSYIDVDGNVLAVTSTINTPFGSLVQGPRTGIVFNNEMDDFSTPNTTNFYGVPASESNFIRPGKRPQSSMSPTIIVDSETGDVRMVVGAAGGTLITTSTLLTTVHTLWLNKTVSEAVNYPRMHHQLLPPELMLEPEFPDVYRRGLLSKGHMVGPTPFYSYVHAIHRTPNNRFEAVSDWREGGAPDGI